MTQCIERTPIRWFLALALLAGSPVSGCGGGGGAGGANLAADVVDASPAEDAIGGEDGVMADAVSGPDSADSANTADGSGRTDSEERADADSADTDEGSGADATTGPSLLAELQPDSCFAEAPAAEQAPDSEALRALPAQLRRWAPMTALLMHAGLPADGDVEGEALLALREAAATDARACADAECVRATLAYEADTRARLESWLLLHAEALLEAQGALALAVDPVAGESEEEWVGAVVALHADALDAGLRFGLGYVDQAALATALEAAAPSAPGALDASSAAIVGAIVGESGHDEAVRYEPHTDGENAAGLARLQTLDLALWPYSAILVPGQGPTDDVTPLSPLSITRAGLAVDRLNAGLAPFILLSGGHVHPDDTPWSEAIEMKRYLMEVHGIAEEQILVDPWARHTTTNLRNAARVLAHMGIGLEHPILVTTDQFQSAYIAFVVGDRSRDELGYVPWRALESLGVNDACAVLTRDSLRVDPSDPRDP
jgi:hypothetical protein